MARRVRPVRSARRVALGAAAVLGGLCLLISPLLDAAAGAAAPRPAPAVTLGLHGDVVVADVAHFPSGQRLTLAAAVPHGHGAVVVTADRNGSARAGFRLPTPTWSGAVQVSGASGRARAVATIQVDGGGGPPNRDGVTAADLRLSAASVSVGATVTAAVTVRTTHAVTFRQIVVSVRDSQWRDVPALDFAADEDVTVDGSRTFTHSRAEDHPDTYQVSIAYTLDGRRWVRLTAPTASFTVTDPGLPSRPPVTATAGPPASPSPSSGTPSPPATAPTAPASSPPPTVAAPTPTPPAPPTAPAPPATVAPPTAPASGTADIPGRWALAFDDEFTGTHPDGTGLDTTRWQLCNPSFRALCLPWNDEQEIFTTAPADNPNVHVSGGQLHLVTTKDAAGQIRSGMVSTGPWPAAFGARPAGYRGFSYTYGYYEGRVRMPRGDGFWPSLWELPVQQQQGALGWPDTGEYDVVEIPGNDPTEYHFTAHWGGAGGACGHPCSPQQATIADSSAGWHTFGLDWEPTGLTWYVDGHKMGDTVTEPAALKSYPFYVIANFSVGGNWPPLHGAPDASTPFPASMDIDWLRVYQHPPAG